MARFLADAGAAGHPPPALCVLAVCGPVVDGGALHLSSGEPASPLVWAPALRSPLGEPLKGVGLRFVNRTEHYRCKPRTRSFIQ